MQIYDTASKVETVPEYAFLVRSCELPANMIAESADFRGRVIAEKLGTFVESLHQSLESFDDGGWQVLSHTLLETNDSLVVSFLIYRRR
jgi:hypothetical protein